MPKAHKRKYEKIDEGEIELVVQCNDSHEFYERYRQAFPNKKKGIDSISKIWKRRSEFLKKIQPEELPPESLVGSTTREIENLIIAQNKILTEMLSAMKEHLKVSRDILAHLSKPAPKPEEPVSKHHERIPEQKEPVKKASQDTPAEIMIGS
ncbi:MAG: hypothetical protein WCF90_03890 [Methanomicrobiales archaeon]